MKIKIINLVIYFILFSSCTSYCLENQNITAPTIICLSGTCSAGKSTLIRAIGECCNLEVVDEDSIMQRRYIDAVAKRFPDDFSYISQVIARENIYHALREKDVLFKKTASGEDCLKALDTLHKIQEELNKPENTLWKQQISLSISEEVIEILNKGIEGRKHVLLDAWYIKEKHLHELFPNIPIVRILLYCPFSVAYERLLKRNAEAVSRHDLHEKRYIRQLIGSFIMLYQITSNRLYSIERIHKHDFDQTFQALSQLLEDSEECPSKPVFTFEEISLMQFLKMSEEFLQPFEDNDNCFIAPRQKYDCIIDNSADQDIDKAVSHITEVLSLEYFRGAESLSENHKG